MGIHITMVRDTIFNVSIVARKDMRKRHAKFHGSISHRRKRKKNKQNKEESDKSLESADFIFAHCNVGINDVLINT